MQTNITEDRRRSSRTPVSYEVYLTGRNSTHHCETRDVSLHGLGLLSDEDLQKNMEMDLSIFIKHANMNVQAGGIIKHCTPLPGSASEQRKLIGLEFTGGHEKGLPFIIAENKHSNHSAKVSVAINADAQTCYNMASDVERFAEWDSGLENATVLERYPDGRARAVRFQRSILIRKFFHTDEFSYNDDEMRLSWHTRGGDDLLVSNTGSYTFKKTGENRSVMTFQIDVTLSVIPANRIVNYLSTIFARKEMKNFKRFVESSTNNS